MLKTNIAGDRPPWSQVNGLDVLQTFNPGENFQCNILTRLLTSYSRVQHRRFQDGSLVYLFLSFHDECVIAKISEQKDLSEGISGSGDMSEMLDQYQSSEEHFGKRRNGDHGFSRL
jgi:hypothetical protein